MLTVDFLGELRERLHVVLGLRLGEVLLEAFDLLRRRLPAVLVEDALDVESRVPDVEVRHRRERGHRLAVVANGLADDAAPFLLGERPRTRRDLEAGDETLDVPFERPRVGLVEVVDVELQQAFG